METMIKREKLDYSDIIFRQLDRINELFSEADINSDKLGDRVICLGSGKIYNAIACLDAMIRFKLTPEDRENMKKTKEECKISSIVAWQDSIEHQVNFTYLNIVMDYIFKSGLLPAERTSYSTGGD